MKTQRRARSKASTLPTSSSQLTVKKKENLKKNLVQVIDLTKRHAPIKAEKLGTVGLKRLKDERNLAKALSSRSDDSNTSIKLSCIETLWENMKEASKDKSKVLNSSFSKSVDYNFNYKEDSLTSLTRVANDMLKNMKEECIEKQANNRRVTVAKYGYKTSPFAREKRNQLKSGYKPRQDLMELIQSTHKFLNRS